MKQNFPVTANEATFSQDTRLISSTDLKGVITHCNQAFIDVSGFQREELLGKSHNIVRHPDMPPAAFETMWGYLKAGKPWMGLVKNRCKNGDFYWVKAYITPVTANGEIVGYESVRSCPARQDVARAEKLYAKIREGKRASLKGYLPAASTSFLLLVFLFAAILFYLDGALWSELLLAAGTIGYALWNRIEKVA